MIILRDADLNLENDPDFIHPYKLSGQRLSRRQALKALGAGSLMGLLAACGSNGFSSSGGISGSGGSVSSGSCAEIPTETKGPYPLDGSGSSTNALSSIYRSNIIGSDIPSTAGVPLLVNLNLQNINASCAAVENAAVYIWHCDQSGSYSGYSSTQNGSHAGKTFCRGIVVTDADGKASFTTLYPGWYSGRITHIHLAVYENNDLTSTPKVSQFGFSQTVTQAVYSVSPYSSHGQNSSVTSFAQDNIFADGTALQIATVTGDVTSGLVASLNVGIPA